MLEQFEVKMGDDLCQYMQSEKEVLLEKVCINSEGVRLWVPGWIYHAG